MKKRWFILIIILTCLFTFFYRLFFPVISIDTEALINNSRDLILSWYSIGRFSLGIIKFLTSWFNFNLILANIAALIVFVLSLIILSKDIVKNKNDYLSRLIFILIIITSPLIAEQFVFTLQIFEISLGYFFLILCFKLINAYIYANKKRYIIPIIIILAFIFGLYQAFCLLYITISVIYFIVNKYDKNNTLKEFIPIVLKYIILLILGLILSKVLSILMMNVLNVSSSSYLTNQIGWSVHGIKGILYVGYYFLTVLLGIKIYYNLSYLIIFIFTLIHLKNNWSKNNIIINLSILFLLITPFIMSIIFGNITVARSQFALPFVVGFLFVFYNNNKKYYYLIPIIIIIFQVAISFILYRNDYIRYNMDVNLMNEVSSDISTYNNLPVVFIGRYDNHIKIKGDVLGESFFNWDSETETGANNRIYGFFLAHHKSYITPSQEQIKLAKDNQNNYSAKINVENEFIVINLSKY
jgi:hypothetical protein